MFIKYIIIIVLNIPKNKPSHVFFGEIFLFRNVLPNNFPKMQANVSLDQIMKRNNKIFFSKNIVSLNGIFKIKNDDRVKYIINKRCFLNIFNFNLLNKIKIAKMVLDISDIIRIKLNIQQFINSKYVRMHKVNKKKTENKLRILLNF